MNETGRIVLGVGLGRVGFHRCHVGTVETELALAARIVDAALVEPLDVASADARAFAVSGGVTGLIPSSESTGEFATSSHIA